MKAGKRGRPGAGSLMRSEDVEASGMDEGGFQAGVEDEGFQAGVDDKGSQAGVEEMISDGSGIGVSPPEVPDTVWFPSCRDSRTARILGALSRG